MPHHSSPSCRRRGSREEEDAGAAEYAVGDEVDYHSGSRRCWLAAEIERVHRDGSYKIRTMEDGRTGDGITAENLRPRGGARAAPPPRFARGDRVEYNSVTLRTWQACKVYKVHSDGRMKLVDRQGNVVKESAAPDRCRAAAAAAAAEDDDERAGTPRRRSRSRSPSPDRDDAQPEPEPEPSRGSLRVDMRVEYDSKSAGAWLPGTVRRVNADGTVGVELDDGRYDGYMSPQYVRVLRDGSAEEAAAATAIAGAFRGRQARSSTSVQQRSRAFDEVEYRDESDFLRQSRNVSSARAGSADQMRSGRSDGRLQRTRTVDEWDAAAGRSPSAPLPSYRGPKPAWPLTPEGIATLIDGSRNDEEPLWLGMATAILTTVKKRLEEGCTGAVVDIPHPGRGGRLVVVGDTHGQLQDFLWILHEHGMPSPDPRNKTVYLINGDVADRGVKATEIFLIIFALKLVYPENIFFTRGNHETDGMNSNDHCGGFQREVINKYNGRTFRLFSEIFNLWPVMAVLDKTVVVCHGGPPRLENATVDMLRSLDTRRQPPDDPRTLDDQLFADIIWSDPHEGNGIKSNERGEGVVTYGRDVVASFLRASGCTMLVRSHECPPGEPGHAPGYVRYASLCAASHGRLLLTSHLCLILSITAGITAARRTQSSQRATTKVSAATAVP